MRRHKKALLAVILAACGDGATPPPPPPPPVATQLSIASQPSSSVQNGVALAVQPVIRLRDATGVPVSQAGVTVTAALVSGAGVTLSNASATTNSSGFAGFSGLTLTGLVGTYTLRFSSGTLTSVDATPVTLTPGAPTQLAVTTQPATSAQAGVALGTQPVVQLRDASGNDAIAAGVIVTAELVSGSLTLANATATTNASGLATFAGLSLSGTVGSYTLRFVAPSLTLATAAAPTVLLPGAPTQVALTTPPSTNAQNGSVLAVQPVIQLRDAFGNNASQAGVRVVATLVSSPAGALTGDTVFTDASGSAAFTALRITGPVGSYSFRFAATGFAPIVASAATVLGAGAATRLAITTQPQLSVASGAAMTTVPVVQLQDQSGNAVIQSGVSITASVVAGTVGLTNFSAATDNTGKATFTGLTLTGLVNAYLLQFASTGLTGVIANNATVLLPGAVTQLSFTVAPSASAANSLPLTSQPVVQLRDAQGNAATTSGVTITATLVSGGAAIANATANTINGAAAFSNLAIVGVTGSYTFRFTAPGATPLDAPAATVLGPGPAKSVTITVEPATSAVSGSALASQPVVQLRDTSGNAVPQSGVTVTATVVGGGSSVSSASAVTLGTGAASFANLALSGPPGSYLLRFGSGSLVTADAAAATTLSAGPPALIAFITLPPTTAVNGMALSTAPVIEVTDITGNPLAGVNVAAGVSGAVTLTSATQTTGSNGRATFTGLTMTGVVSGHSLRFCVGPCGTATIIAGSPVPTSLTVGAPATVTLTTAPSSSGQSGSLLAIQPVARVTDISGNVIGGVSVTVTSPSLTLSGASAITSASGVATFGALGVSGAPAGYTLTFTAGTATATSPLSLSAGAAATLTIDTQPSGTAENGEPFGVAPVVTVRDVTGNGVPNIIVTASPSSGAVAIVNGSATTNGSGVATFTGIGLSGTTGDYTLSFVAGAANNTSGTVSLQAGSAASLAIIDPASTTAINGTPLGAQPRVRLVDGTLNPVAGSLVTASVVGGGVTLTGATAVTDASGDATFSGLTMNGVVGSYTLRYTSGSLSLNEASPTSLGAGAGAALVITTQPSASAQNDAAFLVQPVVQITDQGGNTVSQSGTQITATVISGTVSVGSATATTVGDGSATFSGLKLTGVTGAYRVRFSAAGLGSVDAAAPTALGHGVATQLSLTTQPGTEVDVGQVLPVQPVVQLRDVSGNAVSQAGVQVTAGSFPATATLSGTTTLLTNGSGQAVFTNIGMGPQGVHTMRFTASGLTPISALLGTYASAALVSATPPPPQSAPVDNLSPWVITVPPGADSLVVEISGGTGSADLIVRHGAAPLLDPVAPIYDCFPGEATNNERCVFASPAAGKWYVVIFAFFSYSGVTLRATVY